MRPGVLVENRHRIAAVANRLKRTTMLCIAARWLGWLAVGWPITAAAFFFNWLQVVIVNFVKFSPIIPWFALISTTFNLWISAMELVFTPLGAFFTGILIGEGIYLYFRHDKVSKHLASIPIAIAVGVWTAMWVYSAVLVGFSATIVMIALIPMAWFVDFKYAQASEAHEMRRNVAKFRRELPGHYTVLAAKSPNIQSLDQDLETTVSDAAAGRPILEHPALHLVGSIDGRVYENQIWRTPGRTLTKLKDMADEISAQYPMISDYRDSVQIFFRDDMDNDSFASVGTIRVEFAPRGKLGLSKTFNQMFNRQQPWIEDSLAE